jgi:mono/diheme cytochrome c family protein
VRVILCCLSDLRVARRTAGRARAIVLLATALCAVPVAGAGAQAQSAHAGAGTATKKPSGPSTLSGIYTDEQADRGKDVYAGNCRSCHTPSSHTGATFSKWWKGKQVSDLFTFIGTNMPKNNPGTLDPGDVADVVAFILKMNAMPTGPNELPADADSLKVIRIELKPVAKAPGKAAAKKKAGSA